MRRPATSEGVADAPDIRTLDVALGVWVLVWLVAAVVAAVSIKQLEDGGAAVVTAGDGLDETSAGSFAPRGGCTRPPTRSTRSTTCRSCRVTPARGRATADDVERFAVRVRVTARDARIAGEDAQESARTLAIVLGAGGRARADGADRAFYLLLRPLIAQELAGDEPVLARAPPG